MKSKLFKNFRWRWLWLVGLLAITLFVVKTRLNRFPYTGTWSNQRVESGGSRVKTMVSFDARNGCSWHLDDEPGQPNPLNYVCSYAMHAGSARVELRLPDSQFIKGNWRFARTPAERAQAPLTTLIAFYEVMPLDEGQTLYARSVATGQMDQKTKKITYSHHDDEKTLTRVNESRK